MMNGLNSTVTVNYNTVTVKYYGYCKINVTVTVTDTLIMVRTLNEVKLDFFGGWTGLKRDIYTLIFAVDQ